MIQIAQKRGLVTLCTLFAKPEKRMFILNSAKENCYHFAVTVVGKHCFCIFVFIYLSTLFVAV